MNFRTAATLAAATAGAAAAYVALKARLESIDLRGKSVLITGGSRGLGLQLARDLADEGCRIAICARDEEELRRAQEDISAHGAQIVYYVCDVTRKEDVDDVVEQVIQHLGGIDILINNAGIIQVGPLESLEIEDFEQAMQVMFWGPLYMTLAALPGMRKRRSGHIVNITSVGGKVSVPHLIPYCCAKFAGVALSEGLSAELGASGIRVLTVVPGLMRTGSHLGGAFFKSDAAKEFSWFALGASLPGVSISAETASRSIVHAIQRGSVEEILSLPANLLARLHGVFPEVTLPILRLVNDAVLPTPTRNSEAVVGREAEARLNSDLHRAATSLGYQAARELNQPA